MSLPEWLEAGIVPLFGVRALARGFESNVLRFLYNQRSVFGLPWKILKKNGW